MIVSQELFDEVPATLSHNQPFARRHNTAHVYLLRALLSCGVCHLSCIGGRLHWNISSHTSPTPTWEVSSGGLDQQAQALRKQVQALESQVDRQAELAGLVTSITEFCPREHNKGLSEVTF